MKKIKNKHRLAMGIVLTVSAAACAVIGILSTEGMRFIVSALLFLAVAGVNYYYAFQGKDLVEEVAGCIDERDSFIAMKSCQKMVQVVNYILLGVTLVSLVLYGAFQVSGFLIVAITLCSVLILMFVMTLVMNGYLEKRS